MKNILYRFNAAMTRFMYGRYGNDELSKFLLILSLIAFILSNFRSLRFLYYPAALVLLWSLFRCCSKKIDRRSRERQTYLRIKDRSKYMYRIRKKMWNERKTHKYVKCDGCKRYFRLPKGAGEVIATCPNCKEKIKIIC